MKFVRSSSTVEMGEKGLKRKRVANDRVPLRTGASLLRMRYINFMLSGNAGGWKAENRLIF